MTREDNAYWNYGYDALGQVTSGQKFLASGAPVNGLDYAWIFDDIGNRKTATTNAQISNYSANLLNQYSSKTVPGMIDVLGAAQPAATVTVTVGTGAPQAPTRQGELFYRQLTVDNSTATQYPAIKITGVKNNVGVNGEDAVTELTKSTLVAQTPEVFTHDVDGNLTSDAKWAYAWDGENRLKSVETTATAVTAGVPKQKLEFVYDGQSRRVAKKVYEWAGNAWTLTTSLRFVYDGWNLLAEMNALNSNAVVRTYVWGLDLSGSLQGAGGVGGLLFAANYLSPLASSPLPAAVHAAAADGNGNVSAYVDMATGAKSATYEYGAFGETLIADGVAAEAMPFRFSTKYTDSETGLISYIFRFYDPNRGRWLSKDPIGEDGGLNLYGMVGNDTISRWDYLGLADVGAGRDRYSDRHPKGSCSPDKPCPENVEILKNYLRAILIRLDRSVFQSMTSRAG